LVIAFLGRASLEKPLFFPFSPFLVFFPSLAKDLELWLNQMVFLLTLYARRTLLLGEITY